MKKTIAILLALVMVLTLVACGSSLTSGDLIGVWSGSWEWEGAQINSSIEFERDGTFTKVVYRNNSKSSTDSGTYTIDGNKIECNSKIDHSTMTYKYSGGKITNNGHSLSKE